MYIFRFRYSIGLLLVFLSFPYSELGNHNDTNGCLGASTIQIRNNFGAATLQVHFQVVVNS
ncbi:hypothetical protein [Marinilabilia sp.]